MIVYVCVSKCICVRASVCIGTHAHRYTELYIRTSMLMQIHWHAYLHINIHAREHVHVITRCFTREFIRTYMHERNGI